MEPIIRNGIFLRLITVDDAQFILRLRTDPHLSIYISYTKPKIAYQVKWIQKYKKKEELGFEYYFIAEDQNGNKYGTIRLCNFGAKSFEVGSWVFLPKSPFGMAVKTHMIGVETGFKMLNADYCRIRVNKKNIGVLQYLEVFKPMVIKEDTFDYYYVISKANFYFHKKRLNVINL